MIADDVRWNSIEIERDQDGDNACEDTLIPKPAALQARQVVDCLMNYFYWQPGIPVINYKSC